MSRTKKTGCNCKYCRSNIREMAKENKKLKKKRIDWELKTWELDFFTKRIKVAI